nr:flagellin [Acetobacter garciniae]
MALGLGSGGSNTVSATANAFVSAAGSISGGVSALNTLISKVTDAIKEMTALTSKLGSETNVITTMASYGSTLSDNLTSGVGALTDADMTAESAKLTSLQTKQSLGIKALMIANSQSQNLLSLFQ